MNATDIRRAAEARLAEIATARAAFDVEEAELRAMLGASAPVVLPPMWPSPPWTWRPLVVETPQPYVPLVVTSPWARVGDPVDSPPCVITCVEQRPANATPRPALGYHTPSMLIVGSVLQ